MSAPRPWGRHPVERFGAYLLAAVALAVLGLAAFGIYLSAEAAWRQWSGAPTAEELCRSWSQTATAWGELAETSARVQRERRWRADKLGADSAAAAARRDRARERAERWCEEADR